MQHHSIEENHTEWTKLSRWSLVFIALLALGVYQGLMNYLWYLGDSEKDAFNWLGLFFTEIISWGFWIFIVPAVYHLSQRWPMEKGGWRINLPKHLIFILVVGYGHTLVWKSLELSIANDSSFWTTLKMLTLEGEPLWMMVGALNSTFRYGMVLTVCNMIRYSRESSRRMKEAHQYKLQAAHLEQQLTRAHLDALRMQLNPHFLFNTLNTVAVYMDENVEKAQAMLVRLSDLLRATLTEEPRAMVSLREECDFLKRYLAIEEIRFEDRLKVSWYIQDSLMDARIPSFILQPLVENAIKHGIARKMSARKIRISAHDEDDIMVLSVYNDGPAPSGDHRGIGLSNTEQRLEKLYQQDYELALFEPPGGGAMVEITFPLTLETE